MSINIQARTIEPRGSASMRLPEFIRSEPDRGRAPDVAIALARRSISANSQDELSFILTNDSRSVVFFDRCSLIVHSNGRSQLCATSNEPGVHQRSEFARIGDALARALADQIRPVLVSKDGQDGAARNKGISQEALLASRAFIQCAGSDRLLIVPLLVTAIPIGHLVMEFYPQTESNDHQIQSFLDITPFLATALLEKFFVEKNSRIRRELGAVALPGKRISRMKKYAGLVAIVMMLLCACLLVPVPFTVGGEAEIVSDSTQYAFCRVDGTVREVFVREGAPVAQGDVLARLDSRELDFQTSSWSNQARILGHEISRLVVEAAEKPSILAEKKIVEMKHEAALTELDFIYWKRQYLEIRSPIDGVVLTRDIQGFIGKKYRAGEPFVEIVDPGQLQAAVYVPDTRISYVAVGMPVDIYLNNSPTKAVKVQVDSIAPMAEQLPRTGTAFRVSASVRPVEGLKIGMKGVGRIQAGQIALWRLIKNRLGMMWNQLSLYR